MECPNSQSDFFIKNGVVLHSNDNQAFGSLDKLALYS